MKPSRNHQPIRRLAIVDASPHAFGAQRSMALLAGSLQDEGLGFTVLCPAGSTERLYGENGIGDVRRVCYRRLERRAASLGAFLVHGSAATFATVLILRRERPDVVLANGVQSVLQAAPAAQLLGIPLVWHMRDLRWPRLPARLAARAAQLLTVPSEALLRQASRFGRPTHALPNIIFAPSELHAATPGRDAAPSRPFTIGLVGQLIPRKGHDLLLEALSRSRRRLPDARIRFIGADLFHPDSRYIQSLRYRLCDDAWLRDRAAFEGYREAPLRDMYQGLDLVVVPSREEAFGRVSVEAMGLAVPVVAARVGGLAETCRHRRNALLFEPDDANDLAACIVEMARDVGLRRRLVAEGVRTAAGHQRHALQATRRFLNLLEGLRQSGAASSPAKSACSAFEEGES